jgi:small redox-active disulfide protein 2
MENIARKKIEILGPGCNRCKETFRVVQQVVETDHLEADVVKVESIERMVELGLMATPGVVIDGKVVVSGHIPKADEIRAFLTRA